MEQDHKADKHQAQHKHSCRSNLEARGIVRVKAKDTSRTATHATSIVGTLTSGRSSATQSSQHMISPSEIQRTFEGQQHHQKGEQQLLDSVKRLQLYEPT
ncbi:hypothetical protein AC1031_017189 [Aphanomyces cochlioides]|nr:hypothetical protein AC1031_017189 [Aphanomyces cochlioides]